MTWRERYAPRIANMIAVMKAEGKTVKEMKKALSDANPGEYGHMQKTWANEYMCQLGLSRRKPLPKDSKNPDQLPLL